MKNKTLSPKYYLGIVKTLSVYFIASVATYIFRIIYLKQNISIVGFAAGILDFTMVHYAWYVEMYIGLFLIIPFLNLIYNNLANKKQKQVLIATMIFLSAAPGIVNIWNFVTPGFFVTPSISNIYTQLIPDWWVDLYPLTYYFIGCYLREFGLNISRKNNIILIVLSALFWGIFNIYRCYPVSFVYGSWYDWGALPNVINSVLVFRLLLGINEKRIPLRMQKALAFLSGLTFGGYLMSCITDQIVYQIFTETFGDLISHFYCIPIAVLISFTGALILSFAVNIVYSLIHKFVLKPLSKGML